jgi:2-dehydropantoate 2-reductase
VNDTSWHVLGAGAIGGLWAVRLARHGIPVTLIARDTTAGTRTLTLHHGDNVTVHTFPETTAVACGRIANLLVATKAHLTADALVPLLPRLAAETPVLLLQNGMGQDAPLHAQRPDLCLLAGISTDGVYRTQRDELVLAGIGETLIGSEIGSEDPRCAAVAQHVAGMLAGTGARVRFAADIRQRRWQKLAVNCAINALTARYRCRNGDLLHNTEALAVMQAVCREIAAVMQAEGLRADADALFEGACAAAAATAANISSLRADVEAGRSTEIRFLNGHVLACAEAHGIAAPANAALLAEILALSPR